MKKVCMNKKTDLYRKKKKNQKQKTYIIDNQIII